MSKFTILQGRQASEETLTSIVRLDRLVYPEKYQTILDNIIQWYRKNRDIVTFLLDDGNVIGYLCLLPLERGLYSEIRSGTVVQDVTTPLDKVLEYIPGNSYNVYIFSVVLNPVYHGSDAVKFLIRGMFENIQFLMDKGIVFEGILADAVSEKGTKLVKLLGFNRICESNHDSVIYETTVERMLENYKLRSN